MHLTELVDRSRRGFLRPFLLAAISTSIPKLHPNQLFGALEPASQMRIRPYLESVALKLKSVVCEAGGELKFAYFPEGAVLSLLTVMDNGIGIETANIGREGAFGLFAAMYSQNSFNLCIVQLQGAMVRCPIAILRQEFEQSAHTRDLFVSYSETLLSQVQQTVGCNALHTVEERMCRWLLMMADRAEGENMMYTHEFLSEIMGVSRTSISLAAAVMKREGVIKYHRGLMQVLDRPKMEKTACGCYATVKKRFEAFLTPPSSAIQISGRGRKETT